MSLFAAIISCRFKTIIVIYAVIATAAVVFVCVILACSAVSNQLSSLPRTIYLYNIYTNNCNRNIRNGNSRRKFFPIQSPRRGKCFLLLIKYKKIIVIRI